jgi:hypothetical protein
MGLETDRDAARRRCATDRPNILASARSSGDANIRNKAPFVGNLTWKALQRAGTYLDDQERELIMSIVGTVIFYPEDAARDPEPVATTEPVYKLLSIGATISCSGLSDSLIAQYRNVIAADYAYVFIEQNLRVGMATLDKDYTLQQTQRDRTNLVRQRAQAMLLQLSQEKNLLYQKVGSFRAVSGHLEQLERQLRSSMPQHVMDMLGQQAAFQAR